MTLADGTPLSPALGIGAFAEKTLVAAGQATKVDGRAEPDRGRAARLRRDGRVRRGHATPAASQRDDTIAVFGCGGVGNAAIAAAELAGAHTIIAVDLDARKLEWAQEFGATHTVDASKEDAVEAIQRSPNGNGADVCVEAVGRPEVLKQAFYARDLAGTVVQVGVPTPDMALPDIPMIDFFGRGGALKPSLVRRLPPVARLPDAHRPAICKAASRSTSSCRRRSASTTSKHAFHKMERGEVLRSVVVL